LHAIYDLLHNERIFTDLPKWSMMYSAKFSLFNFLLAYWHYVQAYTIYLLI